MNISKVIVCLLLNITLFWRYVFMWDKEFLLHYILAISETLRVEEIIWFVSEHLDAKSSENFQEFFKIVHRNTSVTQMVFTNNSEARITDSCGKLNYLGVVMTNGVNDGIISVHDNVLLERHANVNVIILVKPLANFEEAKQLLRFYNRRNFINSVLYVKYFNDTSDLLGIRRYPDFAIESRKDILVDLKEKMRKFEMGLLDCQGHKFLTPMRLDVPEVFPYANKRNKTEMLGLAFATLELFTKKINASLVAYEMPNDKLGGKVVNMKEVFELIRMRQISIAAHAYALFRPDEQLYKSKPLLLTKWCLMVPIRNTASPFYYPVIPFESSVWFMILISYLALAITDGFWLWWHGQKHKQPKCNFMLQVQASLTNNICHLLFITAWKHIKCPTVMRFVLYFSVSFHAFFISISYQSLLGSFLTVTLFKEEISVMADFIRANITALIIDYELEFLLKQKLNLPQDFVKLIKPVDPATFYWHQSAFNQSYAYFANEYQWDFLRQQQICLKPGLFKLTDICFGTYHMGFPMELDSPLYTSLGIFISHMKASGLIHHFNKISFSQAVHAGHMQHFKPQNSYEAAGLSHVSMVFLMLIVVYGISTIVFLAECFYFRLSRKCKNVKAINKNVLC